MVVQPSVFFLGIRIDEPVTTLTDLVVSALCFVFFLRLSKYKLTNKTSFYLRYYFLTMGIATFVGGIVGHGFLYLFDAQWEWSDGFVEFFTKIVGEERMSPAANPWKLPGWLTSMFSVALVERASIEYGKKYVKPSLAAFFSWLNIIELLFFVFITFSTLNFLFVEVHTFYGFMIIVLGFNSLVYFKTKSTGSKCMLIAVGFSALAALFFMNQWAIGIWFNHYDISHCLMAISAYFFYRGSKNLLEMH